MIERKFPVFSVILIGILLNRQTTLQYYYRFGTSFVEQYPCLGVDVVGDVDVDVDGGVDGDHAASCSSMLHMNVCLCWFVWSCFLLFAFLVVCIFVCLLLVCVCLVLFFFNGRPQPSRPPPSPPTPCTGTCRSAPGRSCHQILLNEMFESYVVSQSQDDE